MPQFRKKPVVIEAVQFTDIDQGDPCFATSPPQWLLDALQREPFSDGAAWVDHGLLLIGTLEGTHAASFSDWIIRGVKGELYPCKPDIFAATYEPA